MKSIKGNLVAIAAAAVLAAGCGVTGPFTDAGKQYTQPSIVQQDKPVSRLECTVDEVYHGIYGLDSYGDAQFTSIVCTDGTGRQYTLIYPFYTTLYKDEAAFDFIPTEGRIYTQELVNKYIGSTYNVKVNNPVPSDGLIVPGGIHQGRQ